MYFRSLLRMLKNGFSETLWMSSSLSVRICVIGMLINLKVFVLFFSSWNLQWCTKCRGIFTKIFGLTEGWFWFNLLCLIIVMLLSLLFVFRHQASSVALAGFKQICVFTVQIYTYICSQSSVADFRSPLAKDKYLSLGVELVIWAKTRIQAFTFTRRKMAKSLPVYKLWSTKIELCK